jgi:DNA repair photolyase
MYSYFMSGSNKTINSPRTAAALLVTQHKGRGAVSQPTGRFQRVERQPDADWLDDRVRHDEAERAPRTQVLVDRSRSILSYNRSPDVPFDRSINPYRGCEHGCSYCYARPTHAYLGHSPGLVFETRLYAKQEAVLCLRQTLSSPSYQCQPVNIGSVTDAYQPIERDYRITRGLLELLAQCRHPVTIITKSALIERDIDLLAELARQQLVQVFVSITTLDESLARSWEPRAAAPWRRLHSIRKLTEAGIPVGVGMAPVVPFLNEPEIERVLTAAREAGAINAFYSVLRLPHELKTVFTDWLQAHYPDRAGRVLSHLADMRSSPGEGPRLNDSRFGSRMRGHGHWAELIALRFRMVSDRLGYARQGLVLRTDRFCPPVSQLDPLQAQGSLF